MLIGYKVVITFPDGETETVRAYLSKNLSVRARLWNGKRQVLLKDDSVVRGLWPGKGTTWKPLCDSQAEDGNQ